MKTLTSDEVVGLINASPKFAQMVKEAANPSQFNEQVPATMQGDGQPQPGTTYPPNSSPPGQGMPPTSMPPEEEYAAVPEGGAAESPEVMGPESPEAVGARAAQAFLGPVMEAAMAGDPSATDLVARAAGSVAGSVSEAYLRSMNQGAGMQAAGMPAEAAPPPVATPEQELADQIAGPAQAPAGPPVPPQNGEDVEAEENGEKKEEEKDENGQPKKKKPPFPPKK